MGKVNHLLDHYRKYKIFKLSKRIESLKLGTFDIYDYKFEFITIIEITGKKQWQSIVQLLALKSANLPKTSFFFVLDKLSKIKF